MNYFITGISGTLGKAVTEILLKDDRNYVTGISRDEQKQATFLKHERLTLYLGDIRDRARLLEASRNCDVLFHFAALKHVDVLEANPEEGIATNVTGTENVLYAQRLNKIRRVILSATDKGAYPINLYGMCKGIAEKLVLRNKNNSVCRYGNVMASRGSVIPQFVKTLKEENRVYVTDPQMTRFWITIDEAARFVASQAESSHGGLHIPTMKAASVTLIAEAVASIMHVNSYDIKYTGPRPGEKIHECLRMDHEGEALYSHLACQYSLNELIEILRPIVKGLLK